MSMTWLISFAFDRLLKTLDDDFANRKRVKSMKSMMMTMKSLLGKL